MYCTFELHTYIHTYILHKNTCVTHKTVLVRNTVSKYKLLTSIKHIITHTRTMCIRLWMLARSAMHPHHVHVCTLHVVYSVFCAHDDVCRHSMYIRLCYLEAVCIHASTMGAVSTIRDCMG